MKVWSVRALDDQDGYFAAWAIADTAGDACRAVADHVRQLRRIEPGGHLGTLTAVSAIRVDDRYASQAINYVGDP